MKKTYEDAVYPAQLVRTWSREEQYAYWAMLIITDDRSIPDDAPTPNKSARIYSRRRSGMSEFVTVQAAKPFWAELALWLEKRQHPNIDAEIAQATEEAAFWKKTAVDLEDDIEHCDPDDEEHYSGLRNKWMNALALHHSAQEHLETLLNQK